MSENSEKEYPKQVLEGLVIHSVRVDNGKLVVTLESEDIHKLASGTARKVAYEERIIHGFANSGLDTQSGTYPVSKKTGKLLRESSTVAESRNDPDDTVVYRAEFVLNPRI